MARAGACRRVQARGWSCQRVRFIGSAWRRVPVTPRILVACGGAWKVRWRRKFTERQIGESTFRWCNLWSNRRSGSGGGGKTVVFDILKSWWGQWCCSQQRLQMTPKKTRLLMSGTTKDYSSGSDTMLEILENCVVFFNERIYISVLYRRHKCAVQVKCSTSTSVLYK